MLFVSCTYASDTNEEESDYFAIYQMTIIIDKPLFDSTMNVGKDTSEMV